jgi:uncharacterized protein YdeI (YjbR/CyaY-like superfamily)
MITVPLNPIFFSTPVEWRTWLTEHHAVMPELWVGFHKKNTGRPSLTWEQSVDEALCFGWIDGIRRGIDNQRFTIRFTPRKTRSIWSKVNIRNAERLIEQGLMQPTGLLEIERAKADGRFASAYDPPSTAEVPGDLQSALNANPIAEAFFLTLNKHNKYAIMHRIQTAKKPETRERRIRQFVEMLVKGEKIYP